MAAHRPIETWPSWRPRRYSPTAATMSSATISSDWPTTLATASTWTGWTAYSAAAIQAVPRDRTAPASHRTVTDVAMWRAILTPWKSAGVPPPAVHWARHAMIVNG